METINQRLSQNYVDTNSGWSVRLTELRESLVGELRTCSADLVECGRIRAVDCVRERRKPAAGTSGSSSKRDCVADSARRQSTTSCAPTINRERVAIACKWCAWFALSIWLIKLLIAITPPNTPRLDEIGIDLRVFGFTLGVTVTGWSLVWTCPRFTNLTAQPQRSAERQRPTWIGNWWT